MKIIDMDQIGIIGWEITATIGKARGLALAEHAEVHFEFNGVAVRVRADSDPELIYRDWSRGMSGYHKDPVGPYPPRELSADMLANDARIEAEHKARRAIQEREWMEKEARKREALEREIEGVEFDVTDRTAWKEWSDKNSDPYGGAVVSYAEKWGRLMQARMSAGSTLEEIADKASHDADTEGMTGFMYGCAVGMLAKLWRHGEALRHWHNLKTQIRDEGEKANESGGVLNPAILNFG